MTIWERILAALTGIGWKKAANVYLPASGADYPDEFLVYSLVTSPAEQHADDEEILRSYHVQISLYSRFGLVALPDIKTPLKAAGFVPADMRELERNANTGHFGLAMDFVFTESEV